MLYSVYESIMMNTAKFILLFLQCLRHLKSYIVNWPHVFFSYKREIECEYDIMLFSLFDWLIVAVSMSNRQMQISQNVALDGGACWYTFFPHLFIFAFHSLHRNMLKKLSYSTISMGIDVVNVGVSNSSCFFIFSICKIQGKITFSLAQKRCREKNANTHKKN